MDTQLQTTYPVAANEAVRLAEIFGYDFSDGGPNDSLNAICALAQSLFDVPMALVTLLGRDDQVFLGKCGIDADGTPRSDAFCNYTILDDGVFVVPDAEADPRFAANPLVTGEMGIRFYAGAPLILRDGVRIGALCLLDTKARAFSSEEGERLRELATIAVNELRHRRVLIELKREQDLLAQAARMNKLGHWALDVRADTLILSPEARRIIGLRDTELANVATVRASIAPMSIPPLQAAVTALLTRGEVLDLFVYFMHPDGQWHRARCVAEAEVDKDGSVIRFSGSIQDQTIEPTVLAA